jgi:elongation factor Ts
MAISAQDVKQLKEMTQCGMMDCKKALTETSGDVEAAVKYLREKGLAKAIKKSGRVAAEGLVYAAVDGNVGVVVEINSETDFAAKTDRFKALVKLIADAISANNPPDVDALKALSVTDPEDNNSKTINDILTERVATIGENIQIRRFARFEGDVYAYVHDGGGSIIGSLIKIKSDDNSNADVKQAAKDILLQITATPPQFVSTDEVPAKLLEDERTTQIEIAKKEEIDNEEFAKKSQRLHDEALVSLQKALDEANSSGDERAIAKASDELEREKNYKPKTYKAKPLQVIEKVVDGRMKKFAQEIALYDQAFVKEPELTVKQYLDRIKKNVSVLQFARFEKGEGIQKKEDDFAAEVAALTGN